MQRCCATLPFYTQYYSLYKCVGRQMHAWFEVSYKMLKQHMGPLLKHSSEWGPWCPQSNVIMLHVDQFIDSSIHAEVSNQAAKCGYKVAYGH